MKTRTSFLALLIAVVAPGLALAQSTVVFDVDVAYPTMYNAQGPDVDATLSCNAGIPLEQSATVGDYKYEETVYFTVTEVPIDSDPQCTVTFGEIPAGFQLSHAYTWSDENYDYELNEDGAACNFGGDNYVNVGLENECRLVLMPATFDFVVEVDWNISPDADVGVGQFAQVELVCENLFKWQDRPSEMSTTLAAGPGYTGPLALTGLQPDPNGYFTASPMTVCYARLVNYDSAVEIESDCWDEGIYIDSTAPMPVCTITATAFYEGVPTLNQYGMAIMVLLMLGMGFVGFRRFV